MRPVPRDRHGNAVGWSEEVFSHLPDLFKLETHFPEQRGHTLSCDTALENC